MKLFRAQNKPKKLRALLDSEATASLITKQYAEGYHITSEEDTAWYTAARYFRTDGKIKAKLAIPELNPTGKVTYNLHVVPTLGAYDVILGRDILQELGIGIDFNLEIVTWNHACISINFLIAVQNIHGKLQTRKISMTCALSCKI